MPIVFRIRQREHGSVRIDGARRVVRPIGAQLFARREWRAGIARIYFAVVVERRADGFLVTDLRLHFRNRLYAMADPVDAVRRARALCKSVLRQCTEADGIRKAGREPEAVAGSTFVI